MTPRLSEARRTRAFQRRLLRWYARAGRDLPWRHTRDPYRILVSEVMLHQTQVDRVLPKYREWLAAYPTLEALAAAPLAEVQRRWRPLGYNFRPGRLHRIAQRVVHERGGAFPDTHEELVALCGVGRYTAGAILSFAFNRDAPIVDTNVRRVLRRLFGVPGDPMRAPANRRIWQLAAAVIPPGKAAVFNSALLDFGALVCTARSPACPDCPMATICHDAAARVGPPSDAG